MKEPTEPEPLAWEETTEDHYFDMLGVLPPAVQKGSDFLVGEPQRHRRCRITNRITPAFDGFIKRGGKCYATSAAVTPLEFDLMRSSLDKQIP